MLGSPVQARQGARFTLTGAYSIRKSVTIYKAGLRP